MIKDLVKIRFRAFFYYIFRSSKSSSKKMKFLLAGLLIYSAACFYFLSGLFFDSICMPFHKAGVDWLYFSFVALTALTFCFVGSVFATYTQLYVAKDNELLLSMPIKASNILASRILVLLLLIYFFESMIVIPAIVVYAWYLPVSFGLAFTYITASLILPFLALTLSCVVGWIIAVISIRLRSKVLITTVFSIAMLIAYFYFYSKIGGYIQQIIVKTNEVATAVK